MSPIEERASAAETLKLLPDIALQLLVYRKDICRVASWQNLKSPSGFPRLSSPNSTSTLKKLARQKLMWWSARSGEASA